MIDISKGMFFGLLSGLFIAVFSCSDPAVLHPEKQEIGTWPQTRTITFNDVPLEEKSDMLIGLVHDQQYGYENLYLSVIIESQNDTLFRDIFSISLMNDEGYWLGNRNGQAFYVEHPIPYLSNVKQSVSVSVSQYSRESVLTGVNFLNVIVKKKI